MKQKTHKICKNPDCGKEFKLHRTTDQFCSPGCQNLCKPPKEKKVYQLPRSTKPINKKSKKQAVLDSKYLVVRIQFLSKPENQICPVTKQRATEVHHKKGRKGFADQWARDNNISLIIDDRFFLGVSRDGHEAIENNPEWAKENGYSLNRI
jgi:hypothetical protein